MAAAAALVSVAEYLNSTYRPDCDYVDGEVLERNLGERDHSTAQREILYYLAGVYPGLRKRLLPEQRVQVTATRFRIPDVCLLRADAPYESVIRHAPELCIEVLSKDDTMKELMERIRDYFEMGVPVCWLIDPRQRRGWIATPSGVRDAVDGVLRAPGIEMPVAAVVD